MGIMEAWKIEAKTEYEVALALAYKFVVDKEPDWIDDAGAWKELPPGVDSFPDVTFLIELANAASSSPSLLGAISIRVPDTTTGNITDLARARWDGRVNHLGANPPPNIVGTAAAMAEYIKTARHPDYDAILPWDLATAIEAALALDRVYAGQGYYQQALDIAGVVYDSVDGGTYFNSTDKTQNDYILGLAGAILAYEQLDLYPTKVTAYLTSLLAEQQDDGYWNYYSAADPVEKGVQSTAYAALALFKEGTANALTAANNAANWLVSSQQEGGWFGDVTPECADTGECYEVNGEAAWALAVIAAGSTSVTMTASYVPQVGISVTPSSVSFGNVVPGTPSAEQTVTVENTGNVAQDFSTTVANESHAGVYTTGLAITWVTGSSGVAIAGTADVQLVLTVPVATEPGSYSATLVFWAEAVQ